MLVLTTPTGNIGSRLLRTLLSQTDRAERLRVIARHPEKLPPDLPASVEIVAGSTDDPATLRRALTGADALFWCQPDTPTADDYLGTYDRWSRIACDAIEQAGVARVVAITGAGGAPSVPAGPLSGLALIEQHFARTRAAVRFLRCGSFFSNLLWQWDAITRDGVFVYSIPGDCRGPHVATEDIARVAARCLLQRDWTGREAIPLPGPQDLSYDAIAAILTAHLGRPVRYQHLPPDAYRDLCLRSGLSPSAAQGLVDMFAYLASGYRDDPAADRALTPTTLPAWLGDHT